MFYIPIIGSLLEATGMIIEKKIMKKKNIDYKTYTVYGFLAIVAVMIPFIIFFWNIKPENLILKNLIIFSAIVIIALIANLLIFYSLKRETMSEFEPISMMQPLFTILLAFIFSFFLSEYSNERNPLILILALVASITLIAAHIRKNHLVYNKYMIAALLGGFLFSLELVLTKILLPSPSSLTWDIVKSGFTFYFLRCLFILIIAWIIFRPNFKKIDKNTHYLNWIVGIIFVIYRLILYWGYATLGIIYTTVILSLLSPVLIFIFARIFLKEKIKKRQIISAVIIVLCVIAAIFKDVLMQLFQQIINMI